MKEIRILDKVFVEMIPESTISKRITEIANEVNRDFKGEELVCIGILNGAFMFAADLVRHLDVKANITFVKLASYKGLVSGGTVKELIGWNDEIKDKNVLVIEDIIDTGNTLDRIIDELRKKKVSRIKVAALLFKPEACRKKLPIDYIGFEISDDFVVGYGLDYNGYGRNLTSVYKLIR